MKFHENLSNGSDIFGMYGRTDRHDRANIRDLRFSSLLRSELCYLLTEVSGRSLLNGFLKMGPICCPETPARNYQYSLRTSPEERRYYSLRGDY
jgi:hypothetical protein